MKCTEASRLADLSRAIRDSSLKRFHAIPHGFEDWCPVPGGLSVADLAGHLVDADRWLVQKLENPDLPHLTAAADSRPVPDRAFFDTLLRDLVETGEQRAQLLRELTPERLHTVIPDLRFGGKASVWWIIVRGNLDHEIHHRGQLTTYLALLAQLDGFQ